MIYFLLTFELSHSTCSFVWNLCEISQFRYVRTDSHAWADTTTTRTLQNSGRPTLTSWEPVSENLPSDTHCRQIGRRAYTQKHKKTLSLFLAIPAFAAEVGDAVPKNFDEFIAAMHNAGINCRHLVPHITRTRKLMCSCAHTFFTPPNIPA